MSCNPSAFPLAAIAEATRIAPNRNKASDGICGDAAHQATVSDHNPDFRGIPHAFDVTQDDAFFNAHRYGDMVAFRITQGLETRVKYLVSFDYGAQRDKIFDPNIGRLYWRLMDTAEHHSHLHVSFNYTTAAENSTASFFGSGVTPLPSVQGKENDMVICPNKVSVGGKVPCAVLDAARKRVLLFNNAALAYDVPAGLHREWIIPSPTPILAMTESFDPVTKRPDYRGVLIVNASGQTYEPFWS